MKDRIIKFLSENNLTSTKFADEIGVQRSSISHILSGRNKPSFDFIEKMLLAYPDIDAQWLITGKGTMFSNQPSLFNEEKTPKSEPFLTSRESNIQNSVNLNTGKSHSEQEMEEVEFKKEITPKNSSSIERVIVFYTNGSFKEYKPE
jgi:transcriptional regulator with XRE-family HTH domain